MNAKAQALADQFRTFNDQLIDFVKNVPESGWKKRCKGEEWTVGVVARHVGVGHYGSIGLAKMIISGASLPAFTREQINDMGNAHAAKHADCRKEEVVSILEKKGQALVAYVAGLSDADLECSADLPVFGGKATVAQLLTNIILRSAGEHLESMRETLAGA